MTKYNRVFLSQLLNRDLFIYFLGLCLVFLCDVLGQTYRKLLNSHTKKNHKLLSTTVSKTDESVTYIIFSILAYDNSTLC